MDDEEMTTAQHAETVLESWINGQRKQAIDQFKRAEYDACEASELFNEIKELEGIETAFAIATYYIQH